VLRSFAGVEHIIHAGDIGGQAILERLLDLAPLTAVTGNVDWGGPLDRHVRRVERLELAGYQIYITHIGAAPQ
jgi:predicted phosphodiesterase